MGDLASNHIIPTAITYQNIIIENVKGLKELFSDKEYKALAEQQLLVIKEISERIGKLRLMIHDMTEARKKVNASSTSRDLAIGYCEQVLPFFEKIRYEVDKLELIVSDELWPLPKYRELLFLR